MKTLQILNIMLYICRDKRKQNNNLNFNIMEARRKPQLEITIIWDESEGTVIIWESEGSKDTKINEFPIAVDFEYMQEYVHEYINNTYYEGSVNYEIINKVYN